MEDHVCPICDTSNPHDAIHCEVCGERLVPEEADGTDSADQLSSGGGEVVGFAIEDSEDVDDESFGGAPSDATADAMPVVEDDEDEYVPVDAIDEDASDVTDEELLTAAPADETANLDSFDPDEDGAEESATDDDAIEQTGGMEMEDDIAELSDAQFDDVAELQDEQAADDSVPADEDPEYLYSPVDGTAYPRGSEEYEEGFGPNGEELVATAPDFAPGADDSAPSSLAEASGASMDDAELAAAAAPSAAVSAEFQAAFQARRKERPVMAPLPQPGAYSEPAVLTVYSNRQPVMRLAIDMDEVLIGRRDPVADAYPDLDLTDLDPDAHLSRKHAYIYRQNKNYTLYAVSNAGTQLNADLLDLGDRRPLGDGDVIVLAGKIAMKFELPKA